MLSIPAIPHLHIWASFAGGHLLYLWKQADEGSQGLRGIKWIRKNATALSVAAFIGACFCAYWIGHPDFLTQITTLSGLTVQPSPATGGLFGLASHAVADAATNKLGLQKALPASQSSPQSGQNVAPPSGAVQS